MAIAGEIADDDLRDRRKVCSSHLTQGGACQWSAVFRQGFTCLCWSAALGPGLWVALCVQGLGFDPGTRKR